jgi:hypothetical protein
MKVKLRMKLILRLLFSFYSGTMMSFSPNEVEISLFEVSEAVLLIHIYTKDKMMMEMMRRREKSVNKKKGRQEEKKKKVKIVKLIYSSRMTLM